MPYVRRTARFWMKMLKIFYTFRLHFGFKEGAAPVLSYSPHSETGTEASLFYHKAVYLEEQQDKLP